MISCYYLKIVRFHKKSGFLVSLGKNRENIWQYWAHNITGHFQLAPVPTIPDSRLGISCLISTHRCCYKKKKGKSNVLLRGDLSSPVWGRATQAPELVI